MRSFSGDVPIDFQIYGASEAMMATCTHIVEPAFAPPVPWTEAWPSMVTASILQLVAPAGRVRVYEKVSG